MTYLSIRPRLLKNYRSLRDRGDSQRKLNAILLKRRIGNISIISCIYLLVSFQAYQRRTISRGDNFRAMRTNHVTIVRSEMRDFKTAKDGIIESSYIASLLRISMRYFQYSCLRINFHHSDLRPSSHAAVIYLDIPSVIFERVHSHITARLEMKPTYGLYT